MNTTTTDKAPPAWAMREDMTADAVARVLAQRAAKLREQSKATSDGDVQAGLSYQARILEVCSDAVASGSQRINTETRHALANIAGARWNCAKATTEPKARERYMDDCHAFREAVRYLGGDPMTGASK